MKTATVTKRMIISALAGTIMIPGSAITAQAKENDNLPIAGIESVLAECYQSDWQHPIELYLVPTEQEEYSNMVFANVEDFLYVRKEPDEDSEWLGKLYNDGAATAVGTEGDYTLIRSGSVEGYVLTDQLYTGGAAKEYALQAAQKQATVTAYVLNVRSGPGTEYEILTQITKDQTYQVTGEAVDGWYPIRAGETDGWVSGEYVTVTDSGRSTESFGSGPGEKQRTGCDRLCLSVYRQSLCLGRNQSDKWCGLLRIRAGGLSEFWHFSSENFRGNAKRGL